MPARRGTSGQRNQVRIFIMSKCCKEVISKMTYQLGKFVFGPICLLVLTVSVASAEIGWTQGVVKIGKLPQPHVSSSVVYLDVPHMSQGHRPWCVPTSVSMVLRYFGKNVKPAELKHRAESFKPKNKRNRNFTYWADMKVALRSLGQHWTIRDYPKTESGFRRGLNDIRRSLRQGRPVLIDVHLREGHTFVVAGFNDEDEVIYIRDPLLTSKRARILTYADLRSDWHNHRFGNSRSAFYSRP